jgi:MFS family permease
MIAGFVGYILFIFSEGMIGDCYWIFAFTGSIIGSAGTSLVFTATNAGIMTAVPPEMAGVAGAVLQVALQVGSAVALSIQAGLLTIEPGNITNWVNVRASFIFVLGWGLVWVLGFLVFYRPVRKSGQEEEAQRENKVVPHI